MVDAHCLDCFAGSSTLGLEVLFRYAANATPLEMDHAVSQQPRKDLVTLKTLHTRAVNTNVLTFLAQADMPHNVVFIDPPFREGLLEEALTLLETRSQLANRAYICIESEVKNGLSPVPVNWSLYHEEVTGQVAYRLYQRGAQGEYDVN